MFWCGEAGEGGGTRNCFRLKRSKVDDVRCFDCRRAGKKKFNKMRRVCPLEPLNRHSLLNNNAASCVSCSSALKNAPKDRREPAIACPKTPRTRNRFQFISFSVNACVPLPRRSALASFRFCSPDESRSIGYDPALKIGARKGAGRWTEFEKKNESGAGTDNRLNCERDDLERSLAH